MNDEIDGAECDERLGADLAALRERLRGLQAPPFEETGLPAVLRARSRLGAAPREAAPPPVTASPPTPRRWRAPLAAAAAAAVAAIAALLAVRSPVEQAGPAVRPPSLDAGGAAPSGADRGSGAAAFQPLMYAPGFSPSGSYSVVRVRIPLSALAQGPRLEGTIEADLLVGEDGLASGIRFASTDTLFVPAGSR
ncbi:MAG TPA: hypothetical protein VFX89_21310 [Gammaproteobacteria bacterium]|nr:hypothetical protein [Gammaproteobacteria bacterium]